MRLNQLLFCVLSLAMGISLSADAQSYRGRRAGNVSPGGRIADCNLAGTVFMETNKAFNNIDGGRCVMNGARFELTEPSGDMGPYVPLEGMDLRHSSWVAVDFLTPPVFRYTNASQANFSAIHMDGEPVEMVDAKGLIATKTKYHGAQMASWYVQGANFDEAEFSSALLTTWTTDDLAYEGIFDPAPLNMRALTAEGVKFENCLLEECNFAGANLTDGFFVLTKFADECILNGVKFNNAMINQTDFLEANLSGASFREAKVDQSSFETCNMTGAEFIDAVVKKTSFNGAAMRGVSFENAVVEGADFTGTDLSTCNLNNAVMKNLVGSAPEVPKEYDIENKEIPTIDAETGDTLGVVVVYDIVIDAARYNDGYRAKKDQ